MRVQVLVLMHHHVGKAVDEATVKNFVRCVALAVAFGRGREDGFGILAINNLQVSPESLENFEEAPEECVLVARVFLWCACVLKYSH